MTRKQIKILPGYQFWLFLTVLLMLLVNPEYIGRFFRDPQPRVSLFLGGEVPLGSFLIGIAIFLQIFGYLVIRKIIRIRV